MKESTPMLTLEEAVAKYKALWNRYTYTGDTPPENSPLINVVRREEVDAAVRDVALATLSFTAVQGTNRDEVRDTILRLFGPKKAGE